MDKQINDPKVIFGKNIQTIRKGLGISQEELAELSDLDRTYISSVERGKRNISLENICRLAKALNTTPEKLMKNVNYV